jgi:hypothetical protein
MYVHTAGLRAKKVVKAVMENFKFKISLSWTVDGIENPAFLEG